MGTPQVLPRGGQQHSQHRAPEEGGSAGRAWDSPCSLYGKPAMSKVGWSFRAFQAKTHWMWGESALGVLQLLRSARQKHHMHLGIAASNQTMPRCLPSRLQVQMNVRLKTKKKKENNGFLIALAQNSANVPMTFYRHCRCKQLVQGRVDSGGNTAQKLAGEVAK